MRRKILLIAVVLLSTYQGFACSGTVGSVEKIICLADSLKSTLTSAQIATLQLSYSYANSRVWSNLPTTMQPRLGISLGALNATQLSIAKLLVREVSGTTAYEGYEEFEQLLLADQYLKNNGGGSSYGAGLYYLCLNGTPSLTGTFSVKLGGHHLHIENTYNNGVLVGGTPHFEAIEPLSFVSGGTTYQPINEEKLALAAMLASLSSSELLSARLSSTFGDIIMGATNGGTSKDWTFPTTKLGLQLGSLTAAQKQTALAAIRTYVLDVDDIDAEAIMNQYTNDLDDTYIAYAGNSTLNAQHDYVRIDGPNVWIEFSVQNGIIFSGVHYHSIWRDHYRDYGGQGSTAGLQDTQVGSSEATGGLNSVGLNVGMSVYPNPSNDFVTLLISSPEMISATIQLIDMQGRVVRQIAQNMPLQGQKAEMIDLSSLSDGVYFIALVADNRRQTYRVVKQ